MIGFISCKFILDLDLCNTVTRGAHFLFPVVEKEFAVLSCDEA